ncbi:vacuolar protein sorting-associated protein 37B-like [Tubulanus polymorphus]|uniref:vacuolar protein sorting-associated protein 37B-like n=1 Tax=Tubulanus polymorphus TaxID=672921 RepID=UPI003DA48BA5
MMYRHYSSGGGMQPPPVPYEPPGQQYNGSRQSQQPDEAAALGILKHLSSEELQRLLDNDRKMEELIKDLQQVKTLQAERQMMMASNKSLAEFNLSREPRLTQDKERLAATFETMKEARQEFDELQARIGSSRNNLSLDTVHALLMTGASTLDEETENMAEDFLDKKMDVDTFLETYPDRRAKAHLRKVKAEKMSEIMNASNNRVPPLQQRHSASSLNAGAIPANAAAGMSMPGYYMRN